MPPCSATKLARGKQPSTSARVLDWNGDGFDDLAFRFGDMYVWLGSPQGLREVPRRIGVAPESAAGPEVIVLGDVDADGFGDVAVTAPAASLIDVGSLGGSGAVFVYHNAAASPGYASRRLVGAPLGWGFGTSLTSGDHDGDGYPEVVIVTPYSSTPPDERVRRPASAMHVNWFAGDWQARPLWIFNARDDHLLDVVGGGDIDGDGCDDVVTRVEAHRAGALVTELYAYYGQGSGGLSGARRIRFGTQVWSPMLPAVLVPNFDGDGRAELASAQDGFVELLSARDDRRAGAPLTVPFPFRGWISAMVAADFDGDGRSELAIGSRMSGVIVVYSRSWALPALTVPRPSAATFPEALSVGDFDADGRIDLAAVAGGDGGADEVWVYRGNAARLLGEPELVFTVPVHEP